MSQEEIDAAVEAEVSARKTKARVAFSGSIAGVFVNQDEILRVIETKVRQDVRDRIMEEQAGIASRNVTAQDEYAMKSAPFNALDEYRRLLQQIAEITNSQRILTKETQNYELILKRLQFERAGEKEQVKAAVDLAQKRVDLAGTELAKANRLPSLSEGRQAAIDAAQQGLDNAIFEANLLVDQVQQGAIQQAQAELQQQLGLVQAQRRKDETLGDKTAAMKLLDEEFRIRRKIASEEDRIRHNTFASKTELLNQDVERLEYAKRINREQNRGLDELLGKFREFTLSMRYMALPGASQVHQGMTLQFAGAGLFRRQNRRQNYIINQEITHRVIIDPNSYQALANTPESQRRMATALTPFFRNTFGTRRNYGGAW